MYKRLVCHMDERQWGLEDYGLNASGSRDPGESSLLEGKNGPPSRKWTLKRKFKQLSA
ncbi:hypothetical protein GCM10010912_68910 [Paenibacillus albidus]|uniref:Uncharacterized protein n=1 Tax=Paenibacillus albidus TaxID=2041023 RepID=A0A917LDG3_9BACL|nr:hypothetical protein GCM10010912_68910 [Paenibacillus albidus]